MRGLIKGRVSPYYCTETEMLFLDDTFSVLKKLAPASVDMVFADPPYFLSNDGITILLDIIDSNVFSSQPLGRNTSCGAAAKWV